MFVTDGTNIANSYILVTTGNTYQRAQVAEEHA